MRNSERGKLQEFASNYKLKQIVSKPTSTLVTENSKNSIDLIFVIKVIVLSSLKLLFHLLATHSWILCVFKAGVRKLPVKVIQSTPFRNYDRETFVQDLSAVPWSVIECVNSVSDAVFLREKLSKKVADIHAPIKAKRLNGRNNNNNNIDSIFIIIKRPL